MKKYFTKNSLVPFLIGLILTIIIGLVSIIKGNDFLGISFFIGLFSVLFFCFSRYSDQVLAKIIMCAFLLRSGLAFIQRFIILIPGSGGDAVQFENTAWKIAKKLLYNEGFSNLRLSGDYYSKAISWIYYLFGRVPLVAQFLNVILGTLIVFFVYKLSLILFKEKKAARLSAGIVAFFPTSNLYSAILLREIIIVFFLVVSFYFFISWLKKEKRKDYLLSFLFLFLSAFFHQAIILIGFAYTFFFLFYSPLNKKWYFIKQEALIILLIFLIILFFSIYFFELSKISILKNISIDNIEKKIINATRDRAAYPTILIPRTYFDIIWQAPIRIIYFYLSPFVWQIKNWLDIVGFIDALLYLGLFWFSIKSLKQIKTDNKVLFLALIIVFLTFSIAFALGVSNYGTAFRHRQKIVFLLIIISSYSLSKINWRRFLPKVSP